MYPGGGGLPTPWMQIPYRQTSWMQTPPMEIASYLQLPFQIPRQRVESMVLSAIWFWRTILFSISKAVQFKVSKLYRCAVDHAVHPVLCDLVVANGLPRCSGVPITPFRLNFTPLSASQESLQYYWQLCIIFQWNYSPEMLENEIQPSNTKSCHLLVCVDDTGSGIIAALQLQSKFEFRGWIWVII